jgi:hypothetical protein
MFFVLSSILLKMQYKTRGHVMDNYDLTAAYKIALDDFLHSKEIMSKKQLTALQDPENSEPKYIDQAKTRRFAACYDLTMSYLLAKQNIDMNHPGGLSYQESRDLLTHTENIKTRAIEIFDEMREEGFFKDPELQPYVKFWNALYHGQSCDMYDLAQSLEVTLQESRETFEKRSGVKLSSAELGEACYQFSSANEFTKMARLALTVENKHIHEFGDYIANVERLADDIREKHAIDSKLTDKGFVSHYAFALDKEKDVRATYVSSVERCVLSTPAAHNNIAQEFIHVKMGKGGYCTTAQQREHGGNRNREDFIDVVRNVYVGSTMSLRMMGDVTKVLTFCTAAAKDPTMADKMQTMIQEFHDRVHQEMPQVVLGRSKDQIELKDLPLDLLILDAKMEQGTITESERAQRGVLRNVFDAAVQTSKETIDMLLEKSGIQSKELYNDIFNKAVEGVQSCGMNVIDSVRYDNLRGEAPCDGERGIATLRLITHMMAHGEQERQTNPRAYFEAMDFLKKHFAGEIQKQREAGLIPDRDDQSFVQSR